MSATEQAKINHGLWSRTDLVGHYATRDLRPVEATILLRHRGALCGRVLELGSGGGRITGYLAELAADVLGMDVSPTMVEHCRERYPRARFEVGDLRDLRRFADASFEAVVAGNNVLDVLDADERQRTLGELRRILAPGGLLVFSSHNAGAAAIRRMPWHVLERSPRATLRNVARLPRRLRNRARSRPLEVHGPDHLLLNDEAHDFENLHLYIAPDAQERQLRELGFEPLERLDLDGAEIPVGSDAPSVSEVHYIARR